MSQSNLYPQIDYDLVERHMKQARIERSKAIWSMLQSLFSRPESREARDNELSLRPNLRLG